MTDATERLDRRELVAAVLAAVPDALVVTGLGSPSYDVFAAAPERAGIFYLWGAMGGAVPTGLGLALAQPDKQVIVVTGDGEMLMGIGSLGTVAVQQPANLTILVLDNGHYGETGMQQSHSSQGADLTAIASAFGIPATLRLTVPSDVADLAKRIASQSGPLFAQALIATGDMPRAMPSRDGVGVKNAFRAHLGLPSF
ncbi:phosphonopyruvate decarboxylase [Antricoccus suffuscus]|uniref:Phosphonopyruvate decarboxylase n=1 Tax=Antricoccus suffuscus TaxID=1629062 RepID=A0A2T0ZYC9_9ACTN|nr:thiamine pyrophosphate-dependent enzyme [Antricoccus suffuscus]PRZ41247.1 phosphonopyruvate decarboxylase [Antricoccus suffuscus]